MMHFVSMEYRSKSRREIKIILDYRKVGQSERNVSSNVQPGDQAGVILTDSFLADSLNRY